MGIYIPLLIIVCCNTLQYMSNPNIHKYGFKKGASGNPAGKPKGAVSLKTQGWELLKDTITTELTDKFMQEMTKLEGTAYINAYLNVLEFFRPRLSRTESLNQNVNQDQVVISVTNTAVMSMFPENFTEDTEII